MTAVWGQRDKGGKAVGGAQLARVRKQKPTRKTAAKGRVRGTVQP